MPLFQNRWFHVSFGLCTCMLAACSTCPPGVQPGEYYPNPMRAHQVGDANARCNVFGTGALVTVPRDDPPVTCAQWPGGLTKSCRYHQRSQGGFWCPVQEASDSSCAVRDDHWCLEESRCFEQYAICSCSQCPCSNPGSKGPDCSICEPRCDESCQEAAMLVPGARYSCEFGDFFYTNIYPLTFPLQMAEPVATMSIFGDPLRVSIQVYYSKCTNKTQLIFEANATDCSVGIKEMCVSHNVPKPCLECTASDGIYVPSDGFIAGSESNLMAGMVDIFKSGGLFFGCDGETCHVYFQALTVQLGKLKCMSGATCAKGKNTTKLGTVELVNDLSATPIFTVYLLALIAAVSCVALVIVILALIYKFKVVTEPTAPEGVHMAWQGLCQGPKQGPRHSFITNLQGSVSKGGFVGIVGTVGAGKTTLLRILAGRDSPAQGRVLVNGKHCSAHQLRRIVGYVPQVAICCPEDTVLEAIGFAAGMSGGTCHAPSALMDKMNEKVGTLSGGQRRLVDIYVELARRPRVLLLDEPTTGLDNENALVVAMVLKEVAKSIPVVATLHQPRPKVASLLDEVIILREGEVAWHAGSFIKGVSAVDDVQRFLRTLGRDPSSLLGALDCAADLVREGEVSFSAAATDTEQDDGSAVPLPEAMNVDADIRSAHIRPWLWRQTLYLSIRSIKRAARRSFIPLLSSLIAGLGVGLVFFETAEQVTESGVQRRVATVVVLLSFVAVQSVGATHTPDSVHRLVEHEIDSQVYHRGLDAGVRVCGQVVGQLPHAALLMLTVFPMVGFRADGIRPMVFGLCLYSVAVAASLISLAARARSVGLGGAMRGAMATCVLMIFTIISVTGILGFVRLMSPFFWAFSIVLTYELIGLRVSSGYDGRLFVGGETFASLYGLPRRLQPDMSNYGRALACVMVFWMLVAFIVLSVPVRLYTYKRRWRRTSRNSTLRKAVTVEQLEQLAKLTLEGAVPAENPSGQDSEHSTDNPGVPDSFREVGWRDLGNRDTSRLSGGVRSGEFLGILGPCGSGKTTLLTMLSGRVAICKGEVFVNQQKQGSRSLRRLVGYVPQEDALCPDDLVKEAMDFAACTKDGERRQMTMSNSLGGEVLDQQIGILSPGQRRLTSVCVELARRPCALMLDEPTSGLDAASCMDVGRLLKSVSERTPVVATLHQPRPEFVSLLTHIMILNRGEMVVYMPYQDFRESMLSIRTCLPKIDEEELPESVNSPGIPYFGMNQHQMRSINKPDSMQEPKIGTDTVAVTLPMDGGQAMAGFGGSNKPDAEAKKSEQQESATEAFNPVDEAFMSIQKLRDLQLIHDFQATSGPLPKAHRGTHHGQVRLAAALVRREGRRMWLRRPVLTLGRLLLVGIVLPIFLGFMFSGAPMDQTFDGLKNRLVFYLIVDVAIAIMALPQIFDVCGGYEAVRHEIESAVYSPPVYYACAMLSNLITKLLASISCALLLLAQVKVRNDLDKVLFHVLYLSLLFLAMNLLADVLATLTKKQNEAVSVYAGIMIYMCTLGAPFLVVRENSFTEDSTTTQSAVLGILERTSIVYYALCGQIVNEMNGTTFTLVVNQVIERPTTAKQIFDQFHITVGHADKVIWLLMWIAALWLLGTLALFATTRPRQRSARAVIA